MTTHEYAEFLLTLENVPLLVHNGRNEVSNYIGKCYEVYWKPEWCESIFKEEVIKFGHKFEDLEKCYEVFVE